MNQTNIETLNASFIQLNQPLLSAEKVWGRLPSVRDLQIQPLTLRSSRLHFLKQMDPTLPMLELLLRFNELITKRCALHHLWQRVVLIWQSPHFPGEAGPRDYFGSMESAERWHYHFWVNRGAGNNRSCNLFCCGNVADGGASISREKVTKTGRALAHYCHPIFRSFCVHEK